MRSTDVPEHTASSGAVSPGEQDLVTNSNGQTAIESDIDGDTAVAEVALEKGKNEAAQSPLVLDDANNPHKWSRFKKIKNNIFLSMATFALTYSSSVYSSSIAGLEQHYGVTRVPALCTVALFVLGFGVGPFLAAPISEVIGRKPVYVATYASFTVWSWAAVYAPNIAALIIFRFLAGMSGSSSLTNQPASIADFCSPAMRNRYTASYAFAAFAGAAVAPLIGGFVATRASWHWNLIVAAIFTSVAFVLLIPFTDETYAPVLLAKQHHEGRRHDGPSLGQRLKLALIVPFKLLFTEPILAMTAAYLSLLYGIFYGLIAAFPIIYIEIRGWSAEGLALSYIALTLGFVVATIVLRYGQDYAYDKIARSMPDGQKPPPDARFCMLYYTSWMVPFGIFLIAFCSYKNTHWFGDMLGMFCFSMGTQLIFTGLIPFIVDIYLPVAASANAACVAARSITAAGFPLFSTQMYHKLGVPGASCLLAGVALLMTPLPFLFRPYRDRLLKGKVL